MVEEKLKIEDLPFDPDLGNNEESAWEELYLQIEKGNVIPVIGPDFLTERRDEKNLHQRLIIPLAKWAGVESSPGSFSQLLYDRKFRAKLEDSNKKKDYIYALLDQLLSKVQETPYPPLMRLFMTKRFPFVITTSFTPIVERCMKEVWGKNAVRVLQFNNDSQRSMKVGFGDITDENDLLTPTVFYLFGKVSREPHRYVVTDMDMMDFCRTWLSGNGIPRNIATAIRKRYLLFLGGSYTDWLFRFIWFSMRQAAIESQRSSLFVLPENNLEEGDSFEAFLERLETYTLHNPDYVVDRIEQHVAGLDKQKNKTQSDSYVFLSYSRRDYHLAKSLRDSLELKGVKVWWDKDTIPQGERWEQAIENGISHCELFIPLLTENIEREYLEEHEYRREWLLAEKRQVKMGGRPFIIPVAQQSFDLYNTHTQLPNAFKEMNALIFTSPDETDGLAESIARELNKVMDLKKRMSNE